MRLETKKYLYDILQAAKSLERSVASRRTILPALPRSTSTSASSRSATSRQLELPTLHLRVKSAPRNP